MHIGVCVPCREMVHGDFAFDFAKLVVHTAASGCKVTLHQSKGSYIFDQREKLAEGALAAGADRVLMLDDDMRFPADTALRLSGYEGVAGANYPKRSDPITSAPLGLDGKPLVPPNTAEGSTPVLVAAFGCVSIRSDVFEKMPKPWFPGCIIAPDGLVVGEDTSFCLTAAKLGFPVVVDNGLSQEVGHLGVREFRFPLIPDLEK